MALNYGTTSIPGDTYSVEEGGTIRVAAAFTRSVGFVGGMDTENGTATEGEATTVESSSEAASEFGEDSELYAQADLAFENGAIEVVGVPVPETEDTESFSDASNGTLENVPFFNPEIHDDHSIDVEDTSESESVDVNIVYTNGEPDTPSDSDTVNLDYITGEWKADESSSYDFTYTYGDYGTSVLETLVDELPRVSVVLSEHDTPIEDIEDIAQEKAKDLNFTHTFAGVYPWEDADDPATDDYENEYDSERLSLLGNPYGYTDDAEEEMTRVHGAVAGEIASLPLGVSSTRNEISGISGLRTDFEPGDAGDLIDEQVIPLIDYPPITIIKDMTTSETQKFERVYAMDVVDEVLELSREINGHYLGEQSDRPTLSNVERSHKNMLKSLTRNDPPLLASTDGERPYYVEGSYDENEDIELDLAIEIVGVVDNIDVTLRVGDVVDAEVN